MEKNVGGYDRIARFVLGPLLIVVGLAIAGGLIALTTGTLGLVIAALALLVGAVLSVTAVTRKCPINAMLGLNTYEGGRDTGSTTETDTTGEPN